MHITELPSEAIVHMVSTGLQKEALEFQDVVRLMSVSRFFNAQVTIAARSLTSPCAGCRRANKKRKLDDESRDLNKVLRDLRRERLIKETFTHLMYLYWSCM